VCGEGGVWCSTAAWAGPGGAWRARDTGMGRLTCGVGEGEGDRGRWHAGFVSAFLIARTSWSILIRT
jgi:hypothetical protein